MKQIIAILIMAVVVLGKDVEDGQTENRNVFQRVGGAIGAVVSAPTTLVSKVSVGGREAIEDARKTRTEKAYKEKYGHSVEEYDLQKVYGIEDEDDN